MRRGKREKLGFLGRKGVFLEKIGMLTEIFASSKKSVGCFRDGKISKRMI